MTFHSNQHKDLTDNVEKQMLVEQGEKKLR